MQYPDISPAGGNRNRAVAGAAVNDHGLRGAQSLLLEASQQVAENGFFVEYRDNDGNARLFHVRSTATKKAAIPAMAFSAGNSR